MKPLVEESTEIWKMSLFNAKPLKYAVKPSVEEIEVSSSMLASEESKLPFTTRRFKEIDISKPQTLSSFKHSKNEPFPESESERRNSTLQETADRKVEEESVEVESMGDYASSNGVRFEAISQSKPMLYSTLLIRERLRTPFRLRPELAVKWNRIRTCLYTIVLLRLFLKQHIAYGIYNINPVYVEQHYQNQTFKKNILSIDG